MNKSREKELEVELKLFMSTNKVASIEQLCKKTTQELFAMKGFNSRLLEYLAIRLIEHGNE